MTKEVTMTGCHAYLRGYSTGQLGHEVDREVFPEHRMDYIRGYSRGIRAVPRGVVLAGMLHGAGSTCYVHPDEGKGKGSDGFDR